MINCITYGIILSIHVYRSKLIRPRIPFYNHSILKIFMDLILISDRYSGAEQDLLSRSL